MTNLVDYYAVLRKESSSKNISDHVTLIKVKFIPVKSLFHAYRQLPKNHFYTLFLRETLKQESNAFLAPV